MNENVSHPYKKEVKGYVLRRSPRAMVKIPVVIKGVDLHGYEFEEETETYVVSKFGARIFTVHELQVDSVLKLRLKTSDHWSDFRVAWIGSEENNTTGHIGIEFIQTVDFFGVLFPQEDWT
ncbi:MAG: PilZ domain-containing protein [Acidobacteriota bacterium]